MSLKVGDVVQLNSGGPKMTISYVISGEFRCFWFLEGQKLQADFPVASVHIIENSASASCSGNLA